jgi:mono/diheme cytochrome c family protein
MKKNTASLFMEINLAVAALLLAGCQFSFNGDVTPPADYQPFQPAVTQTPQTFPGSLPDPVNGKAIYTEKCAPCHGDTGMGDGELASQAGSPVLPIALSDAYAKASPMGWYQVVTQGDLAKGMPPFNSLTDQQRWDVVAYALTLGMPPATQKIGQQIYLQYCQTCHDVDGRGVSVNIPDFLRSGRLFGMSNADVAALIKNGSPPHMQAFGDVLDSDKVAALVGYIRLLTFASSPVLGQVSAIPTAEVSIEETPTRTPLTQSGMVTINGKIVQPESGNISLDLPVTLHGFDNLHEVFTRTGQADAGGTYRFDGVELITGRVYLVTVDYQGLIFNSEFLNAETLTSGQIVDLPIRVYPASNDATVLSAESMHIILDFVTPGTLHVSQILVLNNPSDRVVVPSSDGKAALMFSIPSQARNVTAEENGTSQNFVQSSTGLGYNAPVIPGSRRQLMIHYDLPFTGHALIRLSVPVLVNNVVVMVTDDRTVLESSQLQFVNIRQVDDMQVQVYHASNLGMASQLELSLTLPGQLNPVACGVAVIIILLAGVGFFLQQHRRKSRNLPDSEKQRQMEINRILDAIIALDDQLRAGLIQPKAYQERRAELKENLRELDEDSDEGD